MKLFCSPENETSEMPNNMVQKSQQVNVGNNQTNAEKEVVGILMELGQSGSVGTGEENATTSVMDSSKTSPSIVTEETPGPTEAIGEREIPATNQNTTPSLLGNPAEVVKDSSSMARTFLQQMGLNKHINTLQDEIVSITEAEISNDNGTQKVILVEVRPKNQKQTVVHMYLVSPAMAPRTDACPSNSAQNPANANSAVPQMSAPALVTTATLPPPPPTPTLETVVLPPPPPFPLVQSQVTPTLPPPPVQILTTTLPPPALTRATSTLPLTPTETQLTTTTLPPLPAQTQTTVMLPLPPQQTLATSMVPAPSTSTLAAATLPLTVPTVVTSTLTTPPFSLTLSPPLLPTQKEAIVTTSPTTTSSTAITTNVTTETASTTTVFVPSR